jgi:hypothetical protein
MLLIVCSIRTGLRDSPRRLRGNGLSPSLSRTPTVHPLGSSPKKEPDEVEIQLMRRNLKKEKERFTRRVKGAKGDLLLLSSTSVTASSWDRRRTRRATEGIHLQAH